MTTTTREYDAIADAAAGASDSREERMRKVADLLWDHLSGTGVSWCGFYVDVPDAPDDARLILGPSRNTPACSPIGLHGVCGQGLTSRTTRIIEDVATLGANYVACDPRDVSEIVIPLFDDDGTCWGVLDLDSWETAAFDTTDEAGLTAVLIAAGLTTATVA